MCVWKTLSRLRFETLWSVCSLGSHRIGRLLLRLTLLEIVTVTATVLGCRASALHYTFLTILECAGIRGPLQIALLFSDAECLGYMSAVVEFLSGSALFLQRRRRTNTVASELLRWLWSRFGRSGFGGTAACVWCIPCRQIHLTRDFSHAPCTCVYTT